MKKVIIITVLALVISSIACRENKNEVKIEPLKYGRLNTSGKFLHANLKNKETGKRVIWFQLFDQKGDKKLIDNYLGKKEKVLGHPAKIFKNKWIWVLVGKRFEIRLMADSQNKDFQNNKKMISIIKKFDLKAMEKYTGPKIEGKDMKKFVPKM